MLAANRQKVLQALGIRSWVKRDRISTYVINSSSVIPAKAEIHVPETRGISNSADILISQPVDRSIFSFDGMIQEKKTSVAQDKKTEIIPEKFVQTRMKPFRLILQPLTKSTLIIAELSDAQAPGLSAQEQRLLANICFAMQHWVELENPPHLVGEAGLFSWPAQAHASLSVDAESVLQGLLAAQKNRGFTEFLLFGYSIKERVGETLEETSYKILPSLYALYHKPQLKKQIWLMMMKMK